MSRSPERILFLQKEEVLRTQRAIVSELIGAAFPEAEVCFAGAPDEVAPGRYPVVIAPTLPWLPQALARVHGCEWVHLLSAGVEKIWDMPVDWSGVELSKSSGIHGPQMSEFVLGAVLYFAKSFDRFVDQSRQRAWNRFWLDELSCKTMMVLGGGAIGEMIGRRAGLFGMRVLSVKRRPEPQTWATETLDFQGARCRLGEVSVLVVCVPLTEATRGMVNQDVLGALAPGAILVDISRGGVVVGDAVAALLDNGHLRGAALDVFEVQPLPKESRLWNRPEVLITPHVAGTSPHYLRRALEVFVANADRWRERESLLTPVDQSARY